MATSEQLVLGLPEKFISTSLNQLHDNQEIDAENEARDQAVPAGLTKEGIDPPNPAFHVVRSALKYYLQEELFPERKQYGPTDT